jgi:hypothetical protein
VKTTDLFFAAYLLSQGEKISQYEVISRGKVACFFDLTEEAWHEMRLRFNSSEAVKIKWLIEQIKDLGY